MAGLVISESEYSHQALSNVLPLRDLFTSFFFVSVGMLFNLEVVRAEPLSIAVGSLGVLAVKGAVAAVAALALGYPLRVVLIAGLALSQIGEFSFLLSRVGVEYGLLDTRGYQLFLAVSVLTMLMTPLVIAAAPRLAAAVTRLPWPRRLQDGFAAGALGLKEGPGTGLADHLIITGFGVNGRNVARAARAATIPYVIVEMNPETVAQERSRGEPIYYGDGSQEEVLDHAGVGRARVLVTTVPDAATTRSTISLARQLSPALHIIARTRFLQEVEPLYELGADEVIPEEFETSVEIFTRVLNQYLVPREEIERFAAEVRTNGYGLFRRSDEGEGPTLAALRPHLHGVEIANLEVAAGSALAGRTLAEVDLRRVHGATAVAVYRGEQLQAGPDGVFRIEAGDELVVLVPPRRLPEVLALARGPATEGGGEGGEPMSSCD
jgi:CPA2 family monovalent cation:H+ antiporter-2